MKRTSLLLVLLVLISCTSKKENTTATTPENNVHQDTIKVTEEIVTEENPNTENNDTSANEMTNEDYYICYTDDDVPTRVIWIRFTKDGKAQQVKYKGQKEAINIVFVSEEMSEGGAHPTI